MEEVRGKQLLTRFQQQKFRHFFYHVLDLNSDHVISQVFMVVVMLLILRTTSGANVCHNQTTYMSSVKCLPGGFRRAQRPRAPLHGLVRQHPLLPRTQGGRSLLSFSHLDIVMKQKNVKIAKKGAQPVPRVLPPHCFELRSLGRL